MLATLVTLLAPAAEADSNDLLARGPDEIRAETRHIVFGAEARDLLLEGWSGRDETDRKSGLPYIWATARESTVALEVVEVEEKQAIVRLRKFFAVPALTIDVRVNGRLLSTIEPTTRFSEFRFTIPADILERGRNVLAFEHSGLVRAHPSDSREFAASYSELTLGPECRPLRPKGPPPRPGATPRAGALDLQAPLTLLWNVGAGGGTLRWSAQVPRKARGALLLDVAAGPDAARTQSRSTSRIAPPWITRNTNASGAVVLEPDDAVVTITARAEPCVEATTRGSLEALVLERPADVVP